MSEMLVKALRDSFGVELESTDEVTFKHNYCEYTVVDVVITDTKTGEIFVGVAFDTKLGIFPY